MTHLRPCALLFAVLFVASLAAADPAPRAQDYRWEFEAAFAPKGFAASPTTPASAAPRTAAFAPPAAGAGLILNGTEDVRVVAERASELGRGLPTEALTVSAWVALEQGQQWGGILSCVQDNGEAERGFVLGYGEETFSFGLASTGADDGDGRLTYLSGKTPIEFGTWHLVTGTFDGAVLRLYVDGQLDAESSEQSGSLLLAPDAPLVLGGYRDANEDFPMDGRLRSAELAERAWSADDVLQAWSDRPELHALPAWTDLEFEFLVEPYLTWPATDAVSVSFEATFPAGSRVRYWLDTARADEASEFSEATTSRHHECRLTGLEPDSKYFYQVLLNGPGEQLLESPVLSFRTAASPGKAFTFVVIGDTQTQGDVAKRVSDLAWMHRPNLVVHAGDLVDTGTAKRDWTHTFFPSMQPLIGRVPLMPVLGNHEQDAEHYYRYMSLPQPERWYSFRYGDAEFFMIDGNRDLADQSAQWAWLESALSRSTATWRFAVLHQPPYTSDSDDYGDTYKESSLQGDPNVRNIVRLLETHGVDMCFSGHVHDYERTFPIRDGQVTEYNDGGVIYITAAGGGGHLEDFDPANTWFGHKKARYHHLVYVGIHGSQLELQAIDEHGQLFDTLTLTKRE